jgi:hypothetical protein
MVLLLIPYALIASKAARGDRPMSAIAMTLAFEAHKGNHPNESAHNLWIFMHGSFFALLFGYASALC